MGHLAHATAILCTFLLTSLRELAILGRLNLVVLTLLTDDEVLCVPILCVSDYHVLPEHGG